MGGVAHRRVGWAYVVAAATIALTGLLNSARMLTDDNPRNDRAAIFLAYVGVLAAASAQIGVRAIVPRRRVGASRNAFDLAPPVLLIVGGVALAAFGIRQEMLLYILFAGLGVSLGAGQMRFWMRPPATRTEYIVAHVGGVGTSCITTVTAFVVVNAHRLGLRTFDLAVWLTPILIGATALTLWRRGYDRRSRRPLAVGGEGATP
jgi:hypothetical protein